MEKTDPGPRRKQPPERGILDAMEDLESKRDRKRPKPASKDDDGEGLDLDKIW